MRVLILAGGSGTRFWPLSRRSTPKQLLALDGDRSLLQATVDRLAPTVKPDRVWIVTTRELAEPIRRQLPEIPAGQVLCEPEGRDTAPAIAWSVGRLTHAEGDGVVAVLPADHRMADGAAFRATLERAAAAVEEGDRVMTLGVEPRWPATGYGYLELGEVLDPATGLVEVRRFTEKPDRETAKRFVDSDRYLWNAGIFLFRGSTFLEHVRRLQPEIAAGLDRIASEPDRIDEFYPRLPAISIDYGVMEPLEEIAALPLDCGWSDLGSWAALAEILEADDENNRVHGDALALEGATENLLWADEGTIAVAGVEGLVVVRTGDAVLVVPRRRAQKVKEIVERLAQEGRDDLL